MKRSQATEKSDEQILEAKANKQTFPLHSILFNLRSDGALFFFVSLFQDLIAGIPIKLSPGKLCLDSFVRGDISVFKFLK